MIDQTVQFVIDGYNYKKQDIHIEILQGSLVSLILFVIYISKVFNKVT